MGYGPWIDGTPHSTAAATERLFLGHGDLSGLGDPNYPATYTVFDDASEQNAATQANGVTLNHTPVATSTSPDPESGGEPRALWGDAGTISGAASTFAPHVHTIAYRVDAAALRPSLPDHVPPLPPGAVSYEYDPASITFDTVAFTGSWEFQGTNTQDALNFPVSNGEFLLLPDTLYDLDASRVPVWKWFTPADLSGAAVGASSPQNTEDSTHTPAEDFTTTSAPLGAQEHALGLVTIKGFRTYTAEQVLPHRGLHCYIIGGVNATIGYTSGRYRYLYLGRPPLRQRQRAMGTRAGPPLRHGQSSARVARARQDRNI